MGHLVGLHVLGRGASSQAKGFRFFGIGVWDLGLHRLPGAIYLGLSGVLFRCSHCCSSDAVFGS